MPGLKITLQRLITSRPSFGHLWIYLVFLFMYLHKDNSFWVWFLLVAQFVNHQHPRYLGNVFKEEKRNTPWLWEGCFSGFWDPSQCTRLSAFLRAGAAVFECGPFGLRTPLSSWLWCVECFGPSLPRRSGTYSLMAGPDCSSDVTGVWKVVLVFEWLALVWPGRLEWEL